jgi:hypothetical protein
MNLFSQAIHQVPQVPTTFSKFLRILNVEKARFHDFQILQLRGTVQPQNSHKLSLYTKLMHDVSQLTVPVVSQTQGICQIYSPTFQAQAEEHKYITPLNAYFHLYTPNPYPPWNVL